MSDNQIGDGPVQSKYKEQMQALCEAIDSVFNGESLPKKTGFVLMAFPMGEDIRGTGRCNYMSNANREQIIVLLKEQLARFEGRLQDK